MRIRVLGPVEAERDGVPVNVGGPQQRRLLALLVLQRGQCGVDRAAGRCAVAGRRRARRSSPVDAHLPLRACARPCPTARSRRARAGYLLDVNGSALDIDEFDGLLGQAEASVPDRALDLYDEALRLWRGDPFGEFADEWWALPETARLRERRVAADLGRAEARMAMGHHNRAIPDLERLVAERPLDERPVTLLMQALQATGRQAESMRAAHGVPRPPRRGDGAGAVSGPGSAGSLRSPPAPDADSAAMGRPLRGYTIHDAIGEGAYGRVYAGDPAGDRTAVAIKVIRPELADSTAFVVRFEAEARLIARLEHPHIVPLYDYWREPGGAYLVFRLLTGARLATR